MAGRIMSKLRWQKNSAGGVTLQRWIPKRTTTYTSTSYEYTSPAFWKSIADVFKAKRGERYVVRIMQPTGSGFDQYQAFTLREAMRLAKFIVGVRDGN